MIKNIIFDIGNVILNFELIKVLTNFTKDEEEQQFIIDNIINSPEWYMYSLIDTGYITKEEAIEIVKDRTNHIKDDLIENFWNHYNDYSFVNKNALGLIKKLKENNYKIYLLSNINPHTYEIVEPSGLFGIVDGYVLSYQVHKIKPYVGIYNDLITKFDINSKETLFIDDNIKNVETANKLGMHGKKVEPDNFDSVINLLNAFNINFK